MSEFELRPYLDDLRQRIDDALRQRLPAEGEDDPLHLRRAMRDAVLVGGKRLRPCMLLASCQAVGGELEQALALACAIELIHCYSLVHDDLPALDDDDTRRGEPTCHKAYGEATAILAGDGLLTLAFEIAATEAIRQHDRREAVIAAGVELARAAGVAGMVGGQALDLALKDGSPSFARLEACHRGKTAALFSASSTIGGLLGGASSAEIETLRAYGAQLGLAFQHADDLRDADFATHRAEALGRAIELSQSAHALAQQFGAAGRPLAALARLVQDRAQEVDR